jgi:hypothetical protein
MRRTTTSRFFRALAVLAVCALTSASRSVTLADDATPSYFSERFGGRISRVIVGDDGSIYVAGSTTIADLPATTSVPEPWVWYDDGRYYFAAKLASDGTPLWTSYISGVEGLDGLAVTALALGPDGSVWIGGPNYVRTVNATLPALDAPGEYSPWTAGFVAKFSPDGDVLWSADLRPLGLSFVAGLAIAANGDAVVSGTRCSVCWGSQAVLTRVHADGSGIRWARRFGGTPPGASPFSPGLHGGGVAIDPSDGSILAAFVGPPDVESPPDAVRLRSPGRRPLARHSADAVQDWVVRFDADGTEVAGARFRPLGERGRAITDDDISRISVSIGADGAVLVGGRDSVARVSPDLRSILRLWRARRGRFETKRIVLDSRGHVFAFREPPSQWFPSTRLVVLDSNLRPLGTVEGTGLRVSDTTLAPGGVVHVVGTGRGAPFPTRSATDTPWSGQVARLPLLGIGPPTAVRGRVVGEGTIELSWRGSPSPAALYEIEYASVLATVDTATRRLTLEGLRPGEWYEFRVVAVSNDGVRATSNPVDIATTSVGLSEVTLTELPDRSVQVDWDQVNGDASWYEVERQIGNGPWSRVRNDLAQLHWDAQPWAFNERSMVDKPPDAARTVRYRVRVSSSRRWSAWTRSPSLALSSR